MMITSTSDRRVCPRHHGVAPLSLFVAFAIAVMASTVSAAPASVALIANVQQIRQEKRALCAQLATLNQTRRQLKASKPSPVTDSWRDAMDAVRGEIGPVKEQIEALENQLEQIRAQLEALPAPDADLKLMSSKLIAGGDVSAEWSAWVQKQAMAGQKDPDELVDRLLYASTLKAMRPVYLAGRKAKHLNAVQKAQRAEHRRARNQAAQVATLPSSAPLPTPFQPVEFESAHSQVMGMTQPPQQFAFSGSALTPVGAVGGLRSYVDQSGAILDQIDDASDSANMTLQKTLGDMQTATENMMALQKKMHDMALTTISNIKS